VPSPFPPRRLLDESVLFKCQVHSLGDRSIDRRIYYTTDKYSQTRSISHHRDTSHNHDIPCHVILFVISLVLLNSNTFCVAFYYLTILFCYAACQRHPGPLLFNKLDSTWLSQGHITAATHAITFSAITSGQCTYPRKYWSNKEVWCRWPSRILWN